MRSFSEARQRSRLLTEEDGAATLLSLFFVLISLSIAGLAIDFSKAVAKRTHLQVTADAVAHAALYTRERESAELAIERALNVAAVNLPQFANGDALRAADIEFGVWDEATRAFTPDPISKSAVRVSAHRLTERGNPVRNFLLNMVGMKTLDVQSSAVYVTYLPTCFREGFVAQREIDVQSNNAFENGFCIHSNDYVKVSSNNYFGENTIVSMPNSENLQMPKSGFETNVGLEEALRDNRYHIRLLGQLDQVISDLAVNSGTTRPSYITSAGVERLGAGELEGSEFMPGRAYYVDCAGGSALFIKDGGVIRETTIVTNCAIKFGRGTTLENAVIATTNFSSKSITAPSTLQIGRNDNCSQGGGAQILTLGGVDLAADMRIYGGQIIAKGDVAFAANADGIAGASIISGGAISGTSNMTMGFCGGGMEENFRASYFRLAE